MTPFLWASQIVHEYLGPTNRICGSWIKARCHPIDLSGAVPCIDMVVSINGGTPNNGWFCKGKSDENGGYLGVPLF